jgi:hypothetical protein
MKNAYSFLPWPRGQLSLGPDHLGKAGRSHSHNNHALSARTCARPLTANQAMWLLARRRRRTRSSAFPHPSSSTSSSAGPDRIRSCRRRAQYARCRLVTAGFAAPSGHEPQSRSSSANVASHSPQTALISRATQTRAAQRPRDKRRRYVPITVSIRGPTLLSSRTVRGVRDHIMQTVIDRIILADKRSGPKN